MLLISFFSYIVKDYLNIIQFRVSYICTARYLLLHRTNNIHVENKLFKIELIFAIFFREHEIRQVDNFFGETSLHEYQVTRKLSRVKRKKNEARVIAQIFTFYTKGKQERREFRFTDLRVFHETSECRGTQPPTVSLITRQNFLGKSKEQTAEQGFHYLAKMLKDSGARLKQQRIDESFPSSKGNRN